MFRGGSEQSGLAQGVAKGEGGWKRKLQVEYQGLSYKAKGVLFPYSVNSGELLKDLNRGVSSLNFTFRKINLVVVLGGLERK